MNPSTPKSELQPSTRLRKAGFGGAPKQAALVLFSVAVLLAGGAGVGSTDPWANVSFKEDNMKQFSVQSSGFKVQGWLTVAVVALTLLAPRSTMAQGPLTPPGPPAPTMKSLDQIEPRTPITNLPYTISVPGSYYLASNFVVGAGAAININADGVTLDLNGFTITSTNNPAGGFGILLNGGRRNIAVYNGHIQGGVTNSGGVFSGPGFLQGISWGTSLQNVRVSGVNVSGCMARGINLGTGYSTVVAQCTVRTVGSVGITAGTVSDSVVEDSGGTGIEAKTAINCSGFVVGGGTGLSAATASNCRGSSGSGIGISTGDGGTLIGCTAVSNSVGISAGNGSTIKDCTALTNGTGIGVGEGSTVIHCTARDNTSGIGAGQYCVVTACVASHNGADGIAVGLGSTVSDCVAANNAGDGIQAADDCRVTGCHCSFNGTDGASYGIHLTGNFARIEGNHMVDNNGRNLKLDIGSGTLVIRNTVSGGGATSFNVPAGNLVGPLLVTSAGVLTNSSPNANFAF